MDQIYTASLSLFILAISIICYVKNLVVLIKHGGKYFPLPPGPRGLPIVGYLPFLRGNLLQQFTELRHKYGPIYRLSLGNKLCVVISSPSLVKEVVRDQDAVFANRDVTVAAFVATYDGNDIAWSPLNPEWRLMRKVFVREMQSNASLDASCSLRRDEIRKAIGYVYGKIGKPIEIGELSFRTELNVVTKMLWGGTIGGKKGERIGAEFRGVITKLVDLLVKPNISDFYPVLAGLDIQGVKKEMQSCVQSLDRILEVVIADYKEKFRGEMKNEGKKDFLQILLELNEKGDSEMTISHRQLKAILMDIVAGGTDTSATTIEWAMAELLNNPNIMSKAQEELSNVVGLNNIVEEHHIPSLKYFQAVLKETLRLHPAIPLLLPKSPSQSSIVGGYTIPKNTRVFINVSSIHRDPTIWNDPTVFKPERFLEDHEKWDFSGNCYDYLPFGSGRRVCAGRPLAERMLIYFMASLLHSFEWKLLDGREVDMSETFGIILRKRTPLFAIPSPRLSDLVLYS